MFINDNCVKFELISPNDNEDITRVMILKLKIIPDKVFEYDGKKAFKNMKKIQNDKNLEIKHNDEFNDDDLINNKSRNKYKDIIDNKEIKDYKNKNIYYSKNNKNFANTDYKNVIN